MSLKDLNILENDDSFDSNGNRLSLSYEHDNSDYSYLAEDDAIYELDSPALLEQEVFLPDSVIDIANENDSWKILVVDDEESIHAVTRIALEGFTFKDKPLEFLHAKSLDEAKEILENYSDIALILLDVVMEKTNAGLELVRYVREELLNPFVRIVLRTGYPGYAPEREVIRMYEINDYRNKAELTAEKIYTIVLTSLRTYDSLITVEDYRRELEQKVKDRTTEIESQKIQLQALNALKDKFFSIISFDLKNPISTLLVFLDILSDDFDKINRKELREIVSVLEKSLNQSFDLLENLTHWSRANTGLINCEPEHVDLKQVVQASVLSFDKYLREKNVHLTNIIPDGKFVNADPKMLHIIFKNLISNAAKFSYPNGDIIIECNDLSNFIEVCVKDNGTGIPPEKLDKLFKIESHYSTSGTIDEKGAGLGLLVCRDFVVKNGGIIYLESFEGKGTTVRFTIPT